MPPRLEADVLTYVDLDIDVIVDPYWSFKILDVDEFEDNSERYGYPEEVQFAARTALNELLTLIQTRAFPFTQ